MANPELSKDSSDLFATKYGISIFPNPVSEKININISLIENGEIAKVYLSDEQGKILIIKEQISKLKVYDLSNYKSGIYYLKIYLKSESAYYKIVKL